MSLKRFLLALAIMAMLAAVTAGGASAAAVTEPSEWLVNGVVLANAEPVTCSIGNHNGEGLKISLHGEVGSIAPKVRVTLTATGVECLESTIFNSEGAAKDAGRLKFTGVTFDEPSNCSVVGGTVETEPLDSELYMESSNPAITYDKFTPKAPATRFALVKIAEGGGCAISGTKLVTGFVYGHAENLTGNEELIQPLTFGSVVESAAGNGLTFAGNPAHLTGTVNNFLTSGAKFGAKHP